MPSNISGRFSIPKKSMHVNYSIFREVLPEIPSLNLPDRFILFTMGEGKATLLMFPLHIFKTFLSLTLKAQTRNGAILSLSSHFAGDFNG